MADTATPSWLLETAEALHLCQLSDDATKENAGAVFATYHQGIEGALRTRTRTANAKEKSLRKQLDSSLRNSTSMRKKEGADHLLKALNQVLVAATKQKWKPGTYVAPAFPNKSTRAPSPSSTSPAAASNTSLAVAASPKPALAKKVPVRASPALSKKTKVSRPRHGGGGGAQSSAGKAKARARQQRIQEMGGLRGHFERLVEFAERQNKWVLRQMRINPIIGKKHKHL